MFQPSKKMHPQKWLDDRSSLSSERWTWNGQQIASLENIINTKSIVLFVFRSVPYYLNSFTIGVR